MIDRQHTLRTFRARLAEAIETAGSTRGAVAERAGVDRSTLSQLLSEKNRRLPRLDTVVALATDQDVSIDWLVGLSDDGQMRARIADTEFSGPTGVDHDERLVAWFAETDGHKVRHVPSTIPDLVKTDAVLDYETNRHNATTASPGRGADASAARQALTQSRATEIEVCTSFQAISGLARGEGVWAQLAAEHRREQLERIAELAEELYPRFRWFLFDGSRRYAAPITIFGPHRAALFLGDNYLVLTSVEHVAELIHGFDDLIRAAHIQPTDVANYAGRLIPHT